MYKGIFITGTDTGVGKTYIACEMARAIRNKGISVGAIKPIATGDREDAKKLINACGIKEPLDRVNPVFLKYPLAPMVSAQLLSLSINLKPVWQSYNYFTKKYDFTIVEGAGGILVPIKKKYFVLDMVKKFSLPVLIVARASLGTINHTLLTVDKLRQQKILIAGIVLNCIQKPVRFEETNLDIIQKLTKLPVQLIGFNKKWDEKDFNQHQRLY